MPNQVLQVLLLGPPDVNLDEQQVTFATRKTLALLIYLATEGGSISREQLSALLWPEASPKRSRANLRNTLSHLINALRQGGDQALPSYLHIGHGTLGLNFAANIYLDLHTVEQAYIQARTDRSSRAPTQEAINLPLLQAAAAYHRGDFLAGFSLGDAPGFDDWADVQREVWRRRMGLIFDRLSEIQFTRGEFAKTTETTARWAALDPLNEVPYRLKMRAHLFQGERSQALETYSTCSYQLMTELGIEPEAETQVLAERIRSQHPHPVLKTPAPTTSRAFLEALFAGREMEYQILMTSYQLADAGQLQAVILRGEAGIGKTRLANKFLAWASSQGAEVLQGRALESRTHLPFQPVLDALQRWLEKAVLPPEWLKESWFVSLVNLLPGVSHRYTSPEPTSPIADIGQPQVLENFIRLTGALASQTPLVLFLDDMQWADSATLDLLLYAIRNWQRKILQANTPPRILLLVSLRSENLRPLMLPGTPNLIGWLTAIEHELSTAKQAQVYDLELHPLANSDTMAMLQPLLSPPASDFAQWICDETHGHPFYLLETLKDLLERRVLRPNRTASGGWSFETDADHDLGETVRVPSSVRNVIRSRLNRLSPGAVGFLTAAAIYEQRINFKQLCRITHLSEDLGLAALDELLNSRLLVEAAQPAAASAYFSANDMIRDVVYTEAGDARRRLFHQRALDVLAQANASAAVLAHHALAAGLHQAALDYCLAAGREALRLSAANEAILYFEQAQRLIQADLLVEPPSPETLVELETMLKQARQIHKT